MNSIYLDKNTQDYGKLLNQGQNEQYFDDFLNDDKCLQEELEPYEFSVNIDAANEDIWDILQIDESDWDEASQNGFLIF